jgi:hypothetical protein
MQMASLDAKKHAYGNHKHDGKSSSPHTQYIPWLNSSIDARKKRNA